MASVRRRPSAQRAAASASARRASPGASSSAQIPAKSLVGPRQRRSSTSPEERAIDPQRGQLLEEHGVVTALLQCRGELGRTAHRHVPVARVRRDVLDMGPPGQDGGGRLGSPARQSGKPVRAVADERQVVGDGGRADPELGGDTAFVDQHVLAAVQLHHPGPAHALAQVLVGRADDDLLHLGVLVGHFGAAGQRVVGLELDHRPHQHPQGTEGLLERPGLGPQIGIDAFTRLVPGPQVVAERLDDVVGGHADVGGPLPQQLQHRADHPPHRGHLVPGRVAMGRRAEEVAEQLVGPVDQVHLHGKSKPTPVCYGGSEGDSDAQRDVRHHRERHLAAEDPPARAGPSSLSGSARRMSSWLYDGDRCRDDCGHRGRSTGELLTSPYGRSLRAMPMHLSDSTQS